MNVYANMPAFVLGKAGTLVDAKGELKSATDLFTSKLLTYHYSQILLSFE
jgi:hypothetical protein